MSASVTAQDSGITDSDDGVPRPRLHGVRRADGDDPWGSDRQLSEFSPHVLPPCAVGHHRGQRRAARRRHRSPLLSRGGGAACFLWPSPSTPPPEWSTSPLSSPRSASTSWPSSANASLTRTSDRVTAASTGTSPACAASSSMQTTVRVCCTPPCSSAAESAPQHVDVVDAVRTGAHRSTMPRSAA